MSLLFNMLSRLVITFLPRSKHLLISWLQSPSSVILEPRKINSDTVSTVSPSISNEVMGPDAMTFIFWMLSFKPTFSLSSFTFIKRLFSSSSLSAVRVVSFYSGMRDSNVWDGGYSISLQRNSDPEWTNNRSKKIAFVWRTEIWRIVVNIALPDLSWYFLTLVYRMLSLLLFNLTFIIKRKEKCVGI